MKFIKIISTRCHRCTKFPASVGRTDSLSVRPSVSLLDGV